MNVFYSCGCAGNCSDDPCDCQSQPCPQCAAVVTTTMPPCIGEKCDELYDCKCIIYNGPDLACYGIYNGDNLCKVLEVAAYGIAPGCAPTTTTTVAPCPCYNYTVTPALGRPSIPPIDPNPTPAPIYKVTLVRYTDCADGIVKYLEISKVTIICSSTIPEFPYKKGTIVKGGCCTATTTLPPRQRCTLSYGRIEKDWSQLTGPVQYSLNKLLLNGLDYANGQILTINPDPVNGNLSVGTGLDGSTYIMNINDWLTHVANYGMSAAYASGFEFHDDMTVIDTPHANSSWSIQITRTDSSNSVNTYYYDSGTGLYSGSGFGIQYGNNIEWWDTLASCSNL